VISDEFTKHGQAPRHDEKRMRKAMGIEALIQARR